MLLYKKRPDILVKMHVIKPGDVAMGKQGMTALIVAFFIFGGALSAAIPAEAAKAAATEPTVTVSPVAAFTSGGPPRKIAPAWRILSTSGWLALPLVEKESMATRAGTSWVRSSTAMAVA